MREFRRSLTAEDATFLSRIGERLADASGCTLGAPVPVEGGGRRPCPGCAERCGQCSGEGLD